MSMKIYFIDDQKDINNLQVQELKKYLSSCGWEEKLIEDIHIVFNPKEVSDGENEVIDVYKITGNSDQESTIFTEIEKVAQNDKCVIVVDLCLDKEQPTGKELAIKFANKYKDNNNIRVQLVSSRLFSLSEKDRIELTDKNIIFFCRPVVQDDDGNWEFNNKEVSMLTAKRKVAIPDNTPDEKSNLKELKDKVKASVNSFNRREQFFGCILAAILF